MADVIQQMGTFPFFANPKLELQCGPGAQGANYGAGAGTILHHYNILMK
jgi:hypothetical protein